MHYDGVMQIKWPTPPPPPAQPLVVKFKKKIEMPPSDSTYLIGSIHQGYKKYILYVHHENQFNFTTTFLEDMKFSNDSEISELFETWSIYGKPN